MIIGIEARSASHPQQGGYKTYVQSLLGGLIQAETQHNFNVYTDRTETSWQPPHAGNVKIVPISNRYPLIRHVWREQLQLSRQAAHDKCNLMHYTANSGPLHSTIPYVVTLHDVISLTTPQSAPGLSWSQLWNWAIGAYDQRVIPTVARHSRAVITVSEFERHQIIQTLRLPPDKVFVTPLAPSPVFQRLTGAAADTARAEIQARYRLPPGFFVAVGYEPRKNITRIIEAYQMLEPSLRKQQGLLIVCARESIRQTLTQQVRALELGDSVQVIGGVDHQTLCQIYNASTAMVFPSLRESFGLPPLEAMACGTPVIAADASSLPEVLGRAAILVPPTDVRALAKAMEAIATTPDLAARLSFDGLERSAQFSWLRTAQQTIDVYCRVAAG